MFLPIFKKYYLTYIEVSKINKIWINYSKIKLVCESMLLLLVPHGTTPTYQRINQASCIFHTYRSHFLIGVS